jgi:pilus assembly protein Flp/PilA
MTDRSTELYVHTTTAIRAIFHREEGASMVEYALLIALIAVVAVAAIALFGNALTDEFDSIQAEVNLANNA